MIPAESSRLFARAIRKIAKYGLSVLTAMVLLIGEHSSAQATFDGTSFQTHDWRSTGLPDAINYQSVPGVGMIIRPANPHQTVEQAFRDHLWSRLDDKIGRNLTPSERKSAEDAIDNYVWHGLKHTDCSVISGRFDCVILMPPYQAEVPPTSASLRLFQEIFESDALENKSTKGKWETLLEAVGHAALFPSMVAPDGVDEIHILRPPNIHEVIRHATPEQLGLLFELDAVPFQEPSFAAKLVAPGTPIDGNNFDPSCTDKWCDSPEPQEIATHTDGNNEGRAVITYRRNAYEQVVVLQPGLIPMNKKQKTLHGDAHRTQLGAFCPALLRPIRQKCPQKLRLQCC